MRNLNFSLKDKSKFSFPRLHIYFEKKYVITAKVLKTRFLYILFILLVFQSFAEAQNTFRKLLLPYRDTIVLRDSFTIVPNSVSVSDTDFTPIQNFIFQHNTLIFKDKNIFLKKILITYRVLPYDLAKKYIHLDSSQINKSNGDSWQWKPYTDPKTNSILPDSKGLDYSGAFSRGISVGNNQDLVVNSNFNLQMSGKLSSDIEVNAAITDNNIPIQPDGNTAQLNQFDRIFIELKRKNTSLSAGDFDMQKPNSYFMNYSKRVQGLAVSHVEKLKNNRQFQTKSAVAVSRGKFSRQIIEPIEGNQGPYRLQGANGERFIIVIAGTEKIYLDGNLAKRGLDNDYTIDYNQGILIFTSKTLIKRELRIVAEFEYNDQNYVRSMYATGAEYAFPRGRIYFNLYGEQDSRNSGTQNTLRPTDKNALAEAGDAPNGILAGGIDTLKNFDKDKILYAQNTDNQGLAFFRFSKNADSARYVLRFVEVPQNQGDYAIKLSDANGRTYSYVGDGKGSFRIGTKLNAPKLLQLYTFGTEYQLFKKKNASFRAEMALSNRDENRFSDVNDDDNFGVATFLNYKQNYVWKKKWRLAGDVAFEKTQSRFKPLNPYRAVEFARDWNTAQNPLKIYDENLLKSIFSIARDSFGMLQYQYNIFNQKTNYDGEQHQGILQVSRKGWNLSTNVNYLTSNGLYEKTNFFRPKIELKKTLINKLTIGVLAERERNNRVVSDTLTKASFYYDLWKTYLQFPAGKKLQFSTYYQERTDFFPLQNTFIKNIFAKEINTTLAYKTKFGFSMNGNISYRNLTVRDEKLTSQRPQETYLGRIDASLSKWKNSFYAQSSYELGSGQEQRIEYFFQKVEPGKGNFTWRDVNKDAQIQQDEIFPVVFQDSANVVRFVVASNQFIRTNNLTISQILNLSPKNIWNKDTSFLKKTLCLFATESAFQIQRKVKLGANVSPWNPFERLSITDTSLVAYATNIRNVLHFNRGNIRYDFQLGSTDNSSRNILTTGYDIRQQREDFFKIRCNISKKTMFRANFSRVKKVSDSEFYKNRNYTIYTLATEPEINWQPTRDFRLKIAYKYSQSLDTLDKKETAKSNDLNTEITYNRSAKTSIRSKFSFVAIDYVGEKNTAVQYAMLNGLQNGQNFLWGLQINQALNKTLQLELRYEGRKTGDVRVIHTGNMAVRAVF